MALNQDIINYFGGKDIDIKTYAPLTLAYIGDDVFDLIIRTIVVNEGNVSPNMLQKKSIRYVCAPSQAKMYDAIKDSFTKKEADIARRGRNSKPNTKAKNASLEEYMKATALETVIGFLYLNDDMERIYELIKYGVKIIKEEL